MKRDLGLAIATVVSLSLGGFGAASAADMAVKAAPRAAIPMLYNWTGFYIGGNVGGVWDNKSSETPSGLFLLPGNAATAFPASINRSGFTGGGQLGYNWQIGTWVWGLEADFNYVDFRSKSVLVAEPLATAFGAGAPPNTFAYNVGRQDFFGTVRGRVGYAWDRLMVYATGGLAYGNGATNSVTYTNAVPGAVYATFQGTSNNRVGWTVGGGLEYALGNGWSVKGEYLFVDLDSHNRTLVPVLVTGTPATGFSFADTGGDRFSVARVGLNYKFGGGPLLARY
jgi:outer membrane immunogenic protein